MTFRPFQILKEYRHSVRAYKAAIATIPASNLTPVQQQQKAQYEQVMAHVQAIIDRPPQTIYETNPDAFGISKDERVSWVVAEEMIPELTRKKQLDSSVSAIVLEFLLPNLPDQ